MTERQDILCERNRDVKHFALLRNWVLVKRDHKRRLRVSRRQREAERNEALRALIRRQR